MLLRAEYVAFMNWNHSLHNLYIDTHIYCTQCQTKGFHDYWLIGREFKYIAISWMFYNIFAGIMLSLQLMNVVSVSFGHIYFSFLLVAWYDCLCGITILWVISKHVTDKKKQESSDHTKPSLNLLQYLQTQTGLCCIHTFKKY